ncbi:Arc family DNA-binding protein [Rugamonas sp.]|uniref:Arc family DNA-binding protein n=1 Tax=Rugamonas sp. TaxID=1926287 RepID=UPI0025F719DE|nr:Arc family DNA-binding protein [Rugamonas sp.]
MSQEVKLQLRLPVDVRDWLKAESKSRDRSMNGQMVAFLRGLMEEAKKNLNQ